MAKISLKVFKKGKPIVWIIGAVLVFVIFYMLFNRSGSGASSGGGVTVQQTGPSEAMQAAALQTGAAIQGANIAANVEVARIASQRDLGALQAQVALAQLGSGERVALETLEYERDAARMNADANMLINEQNLTFGLESARLASETTLGLKMIDANVVVHQLNTNANMFSKQLDTNTAMFAEQSRNLIATTALSQIGNLKKKNRDEALTALTASLTGTPNQYVSQGGGGFNPLNLLAPATALF